jgi:hypothetical protein
MKRREFIQTVAALGASAALPNIDLIAAPPVPIAAVPAAAATRAAPTQATLTFFVDALGNLSFSNEPLWPKTRAEVLGLCPICDRSGLAKLMQGVPTFAHFADRRHDARREADASAHPQWLGWMYDADEPALAEEIAAANAWMLEDADVADLELADTQGLSERGAAMAFFRDQFRSAEALGIKIVEGKHFERTERAATLEMSADEANAMAAARNISIRFEQQAPDLERLDALERLAAESRINGETRAATLYGIERHPLYDHPRIAAVREAIHGMGVSNGYKARLNHSLYAYADQIVTRPIYALGEGWSDFEAIQQVTLEDMIRRSIRTDAFGHHCALPSKEDEATSHGHNFDTARIEEADVIINV